MSRLAIASGRRPDATIGDVPFLSNLLSTVQADARAQLYQQLADFQAIPSRLVRIANQLNAFTLAAPARSLDESATLTTLQAGMGALQSEWNGTNATVNGAIASISGGGNALSVAGDVAQAIAGMTLAAQGATVLEQQARTLVSSSSSLTDAQRAAILAQGAPFAVDLITIAKWAAGAYAGYRLLKWLQRQGSR